MASEKSLEEEQAVNTFGWAAMDSSGVLSSFAFSRRATGEEDVRLKVLYCGICHSDLGCIKTEWGWCSYPLVPGHEIVGIATEVGSKVTKFKVGYRVGVGCMVGSCGTCLNCTQNLESYCPEVIMTCASAYPDGTPTYGGFSNQMVANEKFVIRIPEKLPLDAAAPLLCAGSTVYSAMKFYGLCSQGLHLGVVGLGGLGHVAVKFAKAFGMKVTVISTSLGKKEEAINQLRADSFLINTDTEQMQDAMETMDGIIDTVSALHPIEPLLGLLKSHQGKLIIVGLPNKQPELPVFSLINGRKMIGGNAVGGVKETQEMVDFAAEHNITADIEIVPMDYVNVLRRAMSNFDLSLMLKIHWLLLKPTSYTIFLPKN